MYTVDSITENKARLLLREDESKSIIVAIDQLPPGVKEGDILELTFDGQNVIAATILIDETAAAKKIVESLLEKLKNKAIGRATCCSPLLI